MKIQGIDHVLLTVREMATTIAFYQRVLGLRHELFEGQYNALHFGDQKINLHPFRAEYTPHADLPAPGTVDLCFVSEGEIEDVIETMRSRGIAIEIGPVDQTGARGRMRSIYFRDPDRNLIEVACYEP
jgi:catechol 2,3-dioxygenase-like lactoylglutathione lyase family enzyme